jgi:hypothetical protein
MRSDLILAAALLVGLAGCAAPLVRPDPPMWQSKATHAANWEALADRAVAALPPGDRAPVYVESTEVSSDFDRAFKAFVEERLLAANFSVATEASPDATVLQFDVQRLLYVDGNEKPITSYASLYSAVAAISDGLRHISRLDTAVGAGVAAGPLIDVLSAINDTTPAEVILTTRIESGGRLQYERGEMFYVKPSDLPFYMPGAGPGELPVASLQVGGSY